MHANNTALIQLLINILYMAGVSNKVQGQNQLSKNSDLAHWKALENMKYMDFALWTVFS